MRLSTDKQTDGLYHKCIIPWFTMVHTTFDNYDLRDTLGNELVLMNTSLVFRLICISDMVENQSQKSDSAFQ